MAELLASLSSVGGAPYRSSALRDITAKANDSDSVDGRIKHGLAADLDAAAATLDTLRAALCKDCTLLDVAERLTVAAKR